jgi:hypothetical protein
MSSKVEPVQPATASAATSNPARKSLKIIGEALSPGLPAVAALADGMRVPSGQSTLRRLTLKFDYRKR